VRAGHEAIRYLQRETPLRRVAARLQLAAADDDLVETAEEMPRRCDVRALAAEEHDELRDVAWRRQRPRGVDQGGGVGQGSRRHERVTGIKSSPTASCGPRSSRAARSCGASATTSWARTAFDDVVDPDTGGILMGSNDEITEAKVRAMEGAGIDQVKIRSVLSCWTGAA
jgi:hypothetical protein